MKSTAPRKRRSRAERRLRIQRARDTLEQDLHQPIPAPDPAACNRIMEAVRQAERPSRQPAPSSRALPSAPWIRTAAILGATATVVLLLSMLLRPGSSGPSSAGDGGLASGTGIHATPENPSEPLVLVREEQERLVRDTRHITSFLRDNLRL